MTDITNMIDWTRFRDSSDLYLPQPAMAFLNTYLIGNNDSLIYLNIWSLLHLLTGFIITRLLQRWTTWSVVGVLVTGLIIHTLWEYWQFLIQSTPRNLRGLIDAVMDTFMFVIGFGIAFNSAHKGNI
jgi:hypothetical protein